MKIKAIVVTYNGMKWYKKCFDSLRESSVPVHTIVIDNKSEDNTVAYIKEHYPEITLVESDSNLGFGKANNLGIKYAIEKNADFVFLLNQDAWVKPDTIEKLVNKMAEFPEYGILSPIHLSGAENALDFNFSYYIFPDRCPNLISDFIIKGEAEDKIYPVKFVNAALWLISRECLQTLGGFEPLFPHYGEDENYVNRLEYHNYKMGIYPKAFGIHDRDRGTWNKFSFTKLKSKDFVVSLLIMANIQEPIYKCVYRFIYANVSSFWRNIFHLSIKNAVVNIITFFRITLLLPRISKNRKIAQKGNHAFI